MTEYQPTFPRVKLHRPHAIAGWITRQRLLEQLDQVLQKPVALISAPAGFGKTALLSQWLDLCPLPNTWLQLDENDHELPTFLSGVVAALRQLFPGCLQRIADLTLASGTVPISVWKSALIDDLELLEDEPFILALDDYHQVGNPSIDLLLADVLSSEALPLHLIISARRSPPLSFSRVRVQGQIVEISTADLRFTDAEASLYFGQAAQVSLNSAAIQQLQIKTEGWAAGLALAAISLREECQPEELIARLEGSDSQVSGYLLDQVFNNQSAEIQNFLLKTATFNQFCAAMLSEVLDSEQSEGDFQALLEHIEAAQLFLTPLDNQRSYYRYHHLFRQMLLARQRYHLSPEQIKQFYKLAAAWLIRHEQKDNALGYLIVLQDWVGAAQLVEGQLCALLNAEDYQGIKRRLEYFSEDFITSRPGLVLMQLWIAHFALHLQVTQVLNARIQDMLDAAPLGDPPGSSTPTTGFESISRELVQAQVWLQESMRYYLINQGSLAVPLARKAVEILPETWQFARGNAMIYYGLSLFMEGQYQQAIKELRWEYERLRDPGSTYRARLLFCRSVIYLLNGDLELCRQTAEQLLDDALTYNLLLNQGWGYYLLGRVYQEWNQLELAAEYYLQGVEVRFTSNMMTALECIAGYANILQHLDRGEQAKQFLNSIGELHSEQIAVTPPPLMALTAWLNLENGHPEEARRWAEAFTVPVANQAIAWYHFPHLYKVKILMDTNQPGNSREIDQLLDEIQALAERTHNTFTLMRVLALRAAWLARCGKTTAAQQTLERALRLGRPGWFIHAFVKQGPEMQHLLQAAARRQMDVPGMAEYIAAILSTFSSTAKARAAAKDPDSIKILLTERELEVLELLAERLSNKEIATRLHISPSTVQQHNHHIYRKLNVNNKRQAVASAIKLGILPTKH
jgi:LuxR family maltose regulon positive regulatory protein